MKALPTNLAKEAGPKATRLVCPSCSGAITVEAEGDRGHLTFTCRVGHRFSVPDFLSAKEESLEWQLWASLHGLQEMADLMDDLHAAAERQGLTRLVDLLRDRGRRAADHAAVLRQILEDNRSIELDEDVGRLRGSR